MIVRVKTQIADLGTLALMLAFATRNVTDAVFMAEQATAHGMTLEEALAFQVRCINALEEALVSRGKQPAIAPGVGKDPSFAGGC